MENTQLQSPRVEYDELCSQGEEMNQYLGTIHSAFYGNEEHEIIEELREISQRMDILDEVMMLTVPVRMDICEKLVSEKISQEKEKVRYLSYTIDIDMAELGLEERAL